MGKIDIHMHTCTYMYNIILYFGYIQCNGKSISWSHVEELNKSDTKAGLETTGLYLVPKLKFESVYLSTFAKMRVDLAAQVL